MTSTGITAFDHSLETTHRWLNELARYLRWGEDVQRAYHALRAVLHALRDRLPVAEAADLGAQLPLIVRGFYYEGWRPQVKPSRERGLEHFLASLAREFPGAEPEEVEAVVRAVCRLLEEHVSRGEIEDIRSALPRHLKEFWD